MTAYFNRFEIQLTKDQAFNGCHCGNCDDDINYLMTIPAIRRQLKKIPPESIKAELREYGAWDELELSNNESNINRILWLACGNIVEDVRR